MKKIMLYSGLVIAGGLMSFAFAPYYYFILLPFLIGILFYLLNQNRPKREFFAIGFWFAFGLGGCSTSWIFQALLIDNGSFAWLIPICFISMGSLFGIFWGIPALLSGFYPKGWKRLIAWAALMTIFEWIRSWFLTGFPWNLLGSVWENTLPMLQAASVIGVYGLTFVTLILCATPAFSPSKKPMIYALLGFIALYGCGAWRLYEREENMVTGVQLRLVQPNIPATLKWDKNEAENHLRKLIALSRKNNQNINFVLWPEAAIPFAIDVKSDQLAPLLQAIRQGGYLITGALRRTQDAEEPLANSLIVFDDLALVKGYYDKSHLVPFGEYMPLSEYISLGRIINVPTNLKSGRGVATIHVPGIPSFGSLICYEAIFSGRAVDKKNRPSWLVNITNDGWYGNSAGPYQHLGMVQMRAVEEGLPIARVANTGISAIISPYGEIVKQLPLNTEGVLDSKLPISLKPTIYSRLGSAFPVGISLLLLIFLGIKRKKA